MPATRVPEPASFSHTAMPVALSGAALVGLVLAARLSPLTLISAPTSSVVLCLVFAGVMMGADLLQPRFPGILTWSPMSASACLGLVLTTALPGGADVALSVTDVAIVVGLSGAMSGTVRLLTNPSVTRRGIIVDLASRLLLALVAATLMLAHHVFPQQSIATAAGAWPTWQQLLVYAVVAWLLVAVELPLIAVEGEISALQAQPHFFTEHILPRLNMTASVAMTAAITAVGVPAVGVVAIPLAVLPLGLFQVMARRHSELTVMRRQSIHSLSRIPEAVGFVAEGHAARVAYVSNGIARDLGLGETETELMEMAALLHDLGQVELRWPLPDGATVQAAPADQQRIVDDGGEIMRKVSMLDGVPEVIEAMCMPYHHVVERQADLSLASRIIKVANAYDDFYTQHRRVAYSHQSPRAAAMERIYLGLGYEYDPKVVKALERVLARDD